MHSYLRYVAMVSAIALAAPGAYASESDLQKAVAEVLGRSITLQDLDTDNVPDGAKAPAVDDETRKLMRQEKLRGLVWTAVFDDYAKKRGIVVTPAEIESHNAQHRKFREEDRARRKEQRQALIAEFKSPGLSETHRKQAQQHLDKLNRIEEHDARLAQERRDPAHEKIWQESERQVAEYWVRGWKINQVLYREFGGRLIFQQAGWEPIDAYRKLLERYEGRKAFAIRDPAFKDAVYSYFQHNFVYADESKAKFYFEKPWWERTAAEMKAAGF